jgi:hypothetical protein
MILSHESRILQAFRGHTAQKTQQKRPVLQFFALQTQGGFSIIE